MSYLDARAQYQRGAERTLPSQANAHDMIRITLQELHKALLVIASHQGQGAPAGKRASSSHLSKAFTAIYILQSSLDFEKGGEVSDNLFRVYEFVRLQLLMVFQHEGHPKLEMAAQYIEQIKMAWEDMKTGDTVKVAG